MLYIAGYSDIGSTTRGSIPIPLEPPLSEQAIEVGPVSVRSAEFEPDICIVKLLSDEDCVIDIGDNPDASNGARKLMAGKEQVISVPMGKGFKVAVASANTGSVTGMDSLESLLKVLASPADAKSQFAAMKDKTDKLTAAAKEFQAASAEHKTINDQLVQATADALAAKADAAKAAADVVDREARLDKDARDQADKVIADKAAADARANELDAREAALTTSLADLNKKVSDLADLAGNLDARAKDLMAREEAVAASEADYESRIAKLKALTA